MTAEGLLFGRARTGRDGLCDRGNNKWKLRARARIIIRVQCGAAIVWLLIGFRRRTSAINLEEELVIPATREKFASTEKPRVVLPGSTVCINAIGVK